MNQIPDKYKQLWQQFKTKEKLFHLTTKDNLSSILRDGLIPQDPAPKHWAGLSAIFLANPTDPLFIKTQSDVQDHVAEKGNELTRLYIRTKNQLYRSLDPKRTFQVISLEAISPQDIVKVEQL